MGDLGLPTTDFNMYFNVLQSTSQHPILDDPDHIAWVTLDVEVLKLDVWTLLHGMQVLPSNLHNIDNMHVGKIECM